MKKFLPLAAIILSACAGAQQKQQIADLWGKNDALAVSLRDKTAELDAAKAAKADAETKLADASAKLADASDKLAAASASVDGLTKSNKELSDSIGASKSALGGELKKVVAEKDELAKSLADAQKAVLRLKSAARKAAADLAAAGKERDELKERVDRADREKTQAEEDLSRRRSKLHEDMGAVADSILKEIQAGRAFAAVSGDAVVVKFSDALLFDQDSAKLSDAGAQALERAGRALKALGTREIRVEAHNDAAPLKRGLLGGFEDHWELSAAQAAAVARALRARGDLDPAHLSAVGDAEFHPFPAGDEGCADGRCVAIFAQ